MGLRIAQTAAFVQPPSGQAGLGRLELGDELLCLPDGLVRCIQDLGDAVLLAKWGEALDLRVCLIFRATSAALEVQGVQNAQ
jgi:hypothetical protein